MDRRNSYTTKPTGSGLGTAPEFRAFTSRQLAYAKKTRFLQSRGFALLPRCPAGTWPQPKAQSFPFARGNLLAKVLAVALALVAGVYAKPMPDWYGQPSPAAFRTLPEPQQPVIAARWREDLLSAAIFHETNRRRMQLHLPPFRFLVPVRAAALQHAEWMAQHRELTHGGRGQGQPHERLQRQGLVFRFTAENVAFTFLLRYEAGRSFYTREEGGRPLHSYTPGGPPLAPHTYLSFAESILTQWMNSPGHQKNIISTQAEYLGVGCGLTRNDLGFETIYATQSFFTPMPPATP